MNKERLMKVILAPVVSEKSTNIADAHRQYAFKVLSDATKTEIKQAVELMFKVSVDSVTTAVVKGKTKMFRQAKGQRKTWKKAYVSLKEGHEINFAGAE